jgi:hypothetical protein
MTTLAVLASIAGTWLLGAVACAAVLRSSIGQRDGFNALLFGASYPVGALIVAAWMAALGALGIRASWVLAVAPVALGVALAAWLARHRVASVASFVPRRAVDALLGRFLGPRERWLWIALAAWLALRFAMLAVEVLSRPPLAWEAWLHAAAQARVWHALREPGAFVPEALWWQSGGYLVGLADGQRLTVALDAWTAFVIGRFDDTLIHAPWLAFLAAQALMAYGALRQAGASAIASLGAAAIVATLPASNAHAALGGTSVLPLATYFLGAFAFAWRWSGTRRIADATMAGVTVAGMLASGGGAGVVWAATLVPFLAARMPAAALRRTLAALVVAAALAAIVIARNRLFVPPALQDVPVAGAATLLQHALLLGNWHLLAYGAVAVALLAAREWREPERMPATAAVALGAIAVAGFATSVAARSLLGSTGTVGHAGTALAPTLAVWTAAVANAWWQRSQRDGA